MDLMLLRVFQRQVADQCRFALGGVALIEAALPTAAHDTLWIGCQQFLVGSANVSKALWGQRQKFAKERESLRNSLEVPADSVLRNMSFRNHFEHYDERLVRWWEESKNHNFLDRMIGAPEMVSGLEGMERFRIYDPAHHRIVFWGEEFFVKPIAIELERVYRIAEGEAGKPHWDTASGG